MNKYFINDRFVFNGEDTVFKLSAPFISGSLVVHINGELLDTDLFVQEDSLHIEIKKELELGDVITVTSTYTSANITTKVVSASPNNPNVLFRKYGTDVKLKNNHRYTLNVCVDGEMFSTSFVSKCDPMMSTIKKIRLDTGDLLENVSDEKIYTALYLNSKECLEMIEDDDSPYDSEEDSKSIPKNWVRYKTDLDLTYATYLSLSGKKGSIVKKLGGTIDIQKKVDLPILKDMLSRFQEKFKLADEALHSSSVAVAPTLKAKSNTYPVSPARLF